MCDSPPQLHGGEMCFDSALDCSLSQRVRFGPWTSAQEAQLHGAPMAPPGTDVFAANNTGRVHGHPNGDEPCMVWVLDVHGTSLQWGYAPQLFHVDLLAHSLTHSFTP